MKYTIINGSPHKGNTWRLVEIIQAEILRLSPESVFEEIHLKDLELPYCTGCSICFRKGHKLCPHNCIMQSMMDKIEQSDGVIFAFSTFNMQPPALAKNFIDHMCFMLHRPHFFRNKALVVSTTGGVGAKDAVDYVAGTLSGIGFNRCYKLPVLSCSWNAYKPKEKTVAKCKRVTARFHRDVASKKLHSPSFGILLVYNLFRGMSRGYAQGTEYETEDGVYWTDKIRVNSTYDPSVKVPAFKRAFGSVFFSIGVLASKFVTITYKK